jgi:Uma2 family endonuclease
MPKPEEEELKEQTRTRAPNYTVVLDPAAYTGLTIPESDGEPMDSIWHRDCMMLLISVVAHHCRDRNDYLVGGNNFIYFNPDQIRNMDYRGPDFFYVKDRVDRTRKRKYWAVWKENGRVPDVIIELLSPSTEREDRTTKFTIYEQVLRVPEYFMYDPETHTLDGYRLSRKRYRPLAADERGWVWSRELELFLGNWEGEYMGVRDTYLRFYTKNGDLALLSDEAAQRHADEEHRLAVQEKQRADQAQERADQAQQRADKEKQRAEEMELELARLRALLTRQGQAEKPRGKNGTPP